MPKDIALEMYCWTVFQKGANLITFRRLKNNLIRVKDISQGRKALSVINPS